MGNNSCVSRRQQNNLLCSSNINKKDGHKHTSLSSLDRLSSLPDELLTNILSRLPINAAASTSVLSHHWRQLWTGVTRFELHDPNDSLSCNTYFRISQQLKCSMNITVINLTLKCLNRLPESWFDEMFSHAHNLQQVTLTIEYNYPLPSCLFRCQSLVMLHVVYGFNRFYTCPRDLQILLPNMASLKFHNIIGISPSMVAKLIGSCPVLESFDLTINSGFFLHPPVDSEHLFAPNLKLFKLTMNKLERELLRRSCPKFYIHAPKLKILDISDCFSHYYLVQDPTLIRAYADLTRIKKAVNEDYIRQKVKFVQGLSSVCKLELNVDRATNIFPYLHNVESGATMPIFHNLTHFQTSLINVGLSCWTDLLRSLQHFPNLKHLKVIMGVDGPILENLKEIMEHWKWRAPDATPHCLVYSLNNMCIEGLRGMNDDIELIAYILSHAISLQNLKIEIKYQRGGSQRLKQLDFSRSLFKLPRRSSTCDIVVSGAGIATYSNAFENGHFKLKSSLELIGIL